MKNWLPQLIGTVPKSAYGKKLNTYLYSLEGWRRGLTLEFFRDDKDGKIKYLLSNDQVTRYFNNCRSDLTTRQAYNICKDKHLTKKYLAEANVPTPQGKRFEPATKNQELIDYATRLGFPVVIKPSAGHLGKGVIPNIKNQKDLVKSIKYVRNKLGYSSIIIEKYFKGIDYRVFVIGNQAISAVTRVPASVTGDGKHSIKELITIKNAVRKKNPYLSSGLIKISEELKGILSQYGYSLNSVPTKGERVYLMMKSNASAGGEPIDKTDELHNNIKELAINAVKAIPGLLQGGVDLVVNNDTGVVIEINGTPHTGLHVFPSEGEARDIPKAAIDYYFPGTRTLVGSHRFYFDFDKILKILEMGIVKSVLIPGIPNKPITERLDITGINNSKKFRKWVTKIASRKLISGYLESLSNSKASLMIAGSEENVAQFKNIFHLKGAKKFNATIINTEESIRPVKVGFYTIDSN